MTLNAQGLQGKNRFKKFVRAVLEWGRKDLVHVWCVQEHRFSPEKVAERERMCTVKGLKLIVSPSTATIGTDGKTYYSGGTLVIIYEAAATHLETLTSESGITRVKIEHQGMEHIVASLYAPAQPLARVDFYNSLKAKAGNTNKLCKDTIAGGDFNFVPDATLDVQGPNSLRYSNIGAKIGSDAMSSYALHDYRREQLGLECPAWCPPRVADLLVFDHAGTRCGRVPRSLLQAGPPQGNCRAASGVSPGGALSISAHDSSTSMSPMLCGWVAKVGALLADAQRGRSYACEAEPDARRRGGCVGCLDSYRRVS